MLQNLNSRTKAILSLVLLAAVYAGTAAVTRYLSFYYPLFLQIYVRVLIALVLGFLIFRKKIDYRKLKKISLSEWLLILSRSLAMFVFGAALWVKATTLTKLANVTFVDSLPITAALSFLILKEKVTVRKIALVILAFLGVILLSMKDLSDISSFGTGEILVFISCFFFAYRNISRKWHSKLLNDQEITQLMFFFGFIMLFVVSFIFGEPVTVARPTLLSFVIFVVGGIILIANLFISNYGFAKLPAVFANNILNLEAAFGILFGFIFYRELPNLQELIGGLMIVVSVVEMNRTESKS